jgi:hypothetical protein
VGEISAQHRAADAQCSTLQKWLAVPEAAWAAPETSFSQLHEFVLAVRQAHRAHVLATERAARLRAREASMRDSQASLASASASCEDLVDGVAGRFSSRPALARPNGAAQVAHSADRSAELLRLLLRRASITGVGMAAAARGDSSDEDESGESDESDE